MKRMLINATQPEELRVAIAEGQQLFDLDIEVPSQEQKKSNVYKGKITRVEPSLEACFVEFGSSRHGFLPLKEICESLYSKRPSKKGGKVAIRDVVREGQEIIVQVEKEERGNKGAALTTYISLAGRYLVLMPTNPTAGGVSRRITGNDRDHLREQLQKVTTPNNVGIIVRTAGVGRDAQDLQWDLDYLLQLWTAIEQAAAKRPAPFLVYQESNLFIRALRDHLRNDIGEILIDNETVYNDAREFMQQVMPHNLSKLKLYADQVPLFNRYQIESQIESAFARTVHLPSGGAVVFDHTEALLSIDINSARATKGSDIEETAYNTNMESANEIARQLRLRDLGGLIVIDFIDMTSRKHQREVEECLRRAMQIDKARVQIGRISRFGLLEMSRQRLRPSLGESSQETCPRCEGHGTIRSVESLALSILRLVEEEVMKDYTGQLIVQAPTEVINFLHNEKRAALADVESRHKVPIVMLANQYLVTPHFEILRVRKSDVTEDASYSRVDQPEAQVVANERSQANAVAIPAPAVKRIVPERPVPTRAEEKAPGFFARLGNILFSNSKEEEEEKEKEEKSKPAARKKTTKKTAQQRGNQQSRRKPARGSRQQPNQRTAKKRTSKKTQAKGQQQQQQKQKQQRTSKKRTSKKTQSKQGQQQAGQAKPNQQQAQQRKGRQQPQKQATKQKTQDAVSGNVAKAPVQPAAGSGDVNGNVKPEQKEGGTRRGGRRRRSPYKTGGSKPRPERTGSQVDTSADTGTPKQSPVADKQPVDQKVQTPVKSPDQVQAPSPETTAKKPTAVTPAKAAAKSVEAKSTETRPAKSKASKTKSSESKPAEAGKTSSKPSESKPVRASKPDSKPAEPKLVQASKQDSKPADPKTAKASKPESKPAKPKPAEKPEAVKVAKKVAEKDDSKVAKPDASSADNTAEPTRATKRPVRKKSSSKKTSSKKATSKKATSKKATRKKASKKTASTSKPVEKSKPSPVSSPEKDSHGIYTLKPPPSG
ncbi:MAG: Rne/Rng family ribonuclease [Gammaproteobacteria bacterium]|nr:Rne/Rng family ribonuclease [Gammaproteobacteria bacterium]